MKGRMPILAVLTAVNERLQLSFGKHDAFWTTIRIGCPIAWLEIAVGSSGIHDRHAAAGMLRDQFEVACFIDLLLVCNIAELDSNDAYHGLRSRRRCHRLDLELGGSGK